MSLLDALFRAGVLRTLDHAFAQSLRRLDAQTPDLVLAAAALASLSVSRGHAGLRLDAAQELLDNDTAIDWPDADEWRQALSASRWVATPDGVEQPTDVTSPLVLEGDGDHRLLYLRRYREYERQLAVHLQRIASGTVATGDIAALARLFALLFPDADSDNRQARAAALALSHPLLLVTGGPGTGKTTTITRLLVLLSAQARINGQAAPRIALAAPTGRAAERMAESVRLALDSLSGLGLDPVLTATLPTSGSTLHRLLGTIPDSPRFRHHADNPLPFDVVVVDEASMIDLPLMAKLVDAIGDGTRLILIGDPDQLPSVEAGDVLSGILRAAGDGNHLPAEDAVAIAPLIGPAIANAKPDVESAMQAAATVAGASRKAPGRSHAADHVADADAVDPAHRDPATARTGRADGGSAHEHPGGTRAVFAGRRVHLLRGWRQSESLQLAPLAEAVRAGDSLAALALLQHGELAGVRYHPTLTDPLQGQREQLLAHWRTLADASNPTDALGLAGRLRLLTAVREGPQGARSLNACIETLLTGTQRRGSDHFHGRLIIVTENSYRHGLFNGDIGICLRDHTGAVMAWFPGSDAAQPRAFHPAALPAHESAFAMTVHKAQGSEFDEVWLLLPTRPNRVLSRELVYTGLTRARREVHLAASPEILAQALSRHASRWSGLAWRMAGER